MPTPPTLPELDYHSLTVFAGDGLDRLIAGILAEDSVPMEYPFAARYTLLRRITRESLKLIADQQGETDVYLRLSGNELAQMKACDPNWRDDLDSMDFVKVAPMVQQMLHLRGLSLDAGRPTVGMVSMDLPVRCIVTSRLLPDGSLPTRILMSPTLADLQDMTPFGQLALKLISNPEHQARMVFPQVTAGLPATFDHLRDMKRYVGALSVPRMLLWVLNDYSDPAYRT